MACCGVLTTTYHPSALRNPSSCNNAELQQEQLEISRFSEPSLAEDWLTPEEDEVWQHL